MAAYTTIDNPELYFQAKTYTGNGTAIGSGGQAITLDGSENMQPDLVWIKNRSATGNHIITDAVRGVQLMMMSDNTDAETNQTQGLTSFNSNGFTVGSLAEVNTSSNNFVSWNWKKVAGVFDIQTYTGNGNADGTFIYTGFLPSFVMVKRTSGTGSWWMRDNKIAPFNLASNVLQANDTGVQADGVGTMDFLSNGFKLRDTTDASNTSGGTYIYMAFAEQPFVTSTGVPATAR